MAGIAKALGRVSILSSEGKESKGGLIRTVRQTVITQPSIVAPCATMLS